MNFIKQALLALLLCAMPAAHAASIGYTATSLGGTQWRYDYTVSITTLAVPIEEFTLLFSLGQYAKLYNISTVQGWDVLLVQPDMDMPASIELDPVRPAQVVTLSLAELGLTDGADSVKVSGAVTDVLLQDGSLRFSTPGDTGVNQHAQFSLSKGNKVTTLNLLIQTDLPTAVETYVEPDDDGNLPATAPVLAITGLGLNNRLQPGATACSRAPWHFAWWAPPPWPCKTTAMACCPGRTAWPSASSRIGSSMRPAAPSASAPRRCSNCWHPCPTAVTT
ncbi:hypothetical protein [Janthinobacterium sp. LB3P118]|uniref:hypothetical protein n=1 Tax=Janthinobacterium sp. LB3P118 TaxID=3424195 RepID=UPI003F256083